MLTFELLPDVRHLLVNTLFLQVTHSGTPNVRNKLPQRIGEPRSNDRRSGTRTCVRPRILDAMAAAQWYFSD